MELQWNEHRRGHKCLLGRKQCTIRQHRLVLCPREQPSRLGCQRRRRVDGDFSTRGGSCRRDQRDGWRTGGRPRRAHCQWQRKCHRLHLELQHSTARRRRRIAGERYGWSNVAVEQQHDPHWQAGGRGRVSVSIEFRSRHSGSDSRHVQFTAGIWGAIGQHHH